MPRGSTTWHVTAGPLSWHPWGVDFLPPDINGLPLHPLVVHAAVVLIPLTGLLALVMVLIPRFSYRFGPLILVLGWLAAVALSWRLADRRPFRLHLVAGVATGVAVLSTARIFGKVWYYLTLWSWMIALVAVAATLWTAVILVEQRWRRLPMTAVAGAVLAVASLVFVVDAARVDPPEDHLGSVLTDLVGPTADALRAGEGAATGVAVDFRNGHPGPCRPDEQRTDDFR